MLRPQLKSRKTETYAFGCAVTYPQQKDGRLTAVKPTVDLKMKRFMLILTSQRFGSYTSHWLTSCAQMYLSPAGHARGCVFTLSHSSPSPRPPTTTHTDSGLGLINRIYAAPVSALSPPLAGGDNLWTLWMTSGPFARPPVASWLYLLIPFSVCLHLLTGFNLPALALTPQKSPFPIIFYSDWLRLCWHSLNIQLSQRRSRPSPGMHKGDT